MAGLIHLELLTDFFNKIDPNRTSPRKFHFKFRFKFHFLSRRVAERSQLSLGCDYTARVAAESAPSIERPYGSMTF